MPKRNPRAESVRPEEKRVPPSVNGIELAERGPGQGLRLLTFNIQAGITTANYRDYVTKGWQQVLPHRQRMVNLNAIAQVVSDYDIVGLQEVDDGSLRTGFLNQTQYLAQHAGFPFWSDQPNRKVAKIARTCNSLLSRIRPNAVHDHKLPGRIPGRGALVARYGDDENALLVVVVHLALGRRSRAEQLTFVRQLIDPYRHVVVMGDMNAPLSNAEMREFVALSALHTPGMGGCTFPSWRPQRGIDHILVSGSIAALGCRVLDITLSDHLPLALDIEVPPECLQPP